MNEKMLNIEIDDMPTQVPQGSVVLDAAKKLGIHIPTLCHHEAVELQASCRICIVEMQVSKRGRTYTWVDAACAYPVEEGLKIRTNSEKIIRERKLILELLLSRAPKSKLLNQMAEKYGISQKRFVSYDKGESNCILCGLCTRVCSGPIGVGGIGTAFRGIHKKIVTPYKVTAEVCIGCSTCANVCPTDAIEPKGDAENMHMEIWDSWHDMQTCVICGTPFASKKHIQAIKEKAGVSIHPQIYDTCPDCRRISKLKY